MEYILVGVVGLVIALGAFIYAYVTRDNYYFWDIGGYLCFMFGLILILLSILGYLIFKPNLLTVYDINGNIRFQGEGVVSTVDLPNISIRTKDGKVYNIKLENGESYLKEK